jgi:hypothetical protein
MNFLGLFNGANKTYFLLSAIVNLYGINLCLGVQSGSGILVMGEEFMGLCGNFGSRNKSGCNKNES